MAALSLRRNGRFLPLRLTSTLLLIGALLWILITLFSSSDTDTMTDERLQWLKQQTRLGDYVKESFHGVKEMLKHKEVKVVGLVFCERHVFSESLHSC